MIETTEQFKEREQRESEARKIAKEKNIQAEISIRSGMANETIAEAFVRAKSSSGEERRTSRRILRDLKRFQTTGRISNFLANQVAQDNASKINSRKTIDSNKDSLVSVGLPVTLKTALPNLTSDPPKKKTSTEQDCALGLYVSKNNVWVSAGVVNNDLPMGFDPQDGKQVASGGSGYVWVEVEIDEETGYIESVEVNNGSSTPEDTTTSFRYTLGYYTYNNGPPSVTNYDCGSVVFFTCRNWYTTEPPLYTGVFSR